VSEEANGTSNTARAITISTFIAFLALPATGIRVEWYCQRILGVVRLETRAPQAARVAKLIAEVKEIARRAVEFGTRRAFSIR
jgi:hypothetical protein